MPRPTVTWTFANLVDFEVLLARDQVLQDPPNQARVEERDRRLARDIAQDSTNVQQADRTPDRRTLFRAWLDRRLQQVQNPAELTPGAATALAFTLSSLILALMGFASGKGVLLLVLTGAGMRSTPDEPVNVLFFLVACILPQVLFALGALGLMLAQGRTRLPAPPAALRSLVAVVIRPIFGWLLGKLWHSLEGRKRQELAAAMGWLRGRTVTHAEALRWPVFGLLHSFALGYATAILLGSLLSVQIWHQTFAWQTTVQAYTPERVHRVIQFVALPWSWALPEGSGYPTLADVTVTRFHRHQDPATLHPESTGSWWLFVVLAALTYGFLPRLLLWLWGKWKLRSALRHEPFDTLVLDPLYERLTHPRVAWHGPETTWASQPASLPSSDPSQREPQPMASPGPATLLLSTELSSSALQRALADHLKTWNGWEPRKSMEFDSTTSGRYQLFDQLKNAGEDEAQQRILILHEAFMPPTREVLDFLRDLRRVVGPRSRLLVALIGKPSTDPLGQPVSPVHSGVWRNQVRTLGDPNLDAQPLLPS
jgi:hypothetical protein